MLIICGSGCSNYKMSWILVRGFRLSHFHKTVQSSIHIVSLLTVLHCCSAGECCDSGSGSRRAKMAQKQRSAEFSLLSFEGLIPLLLHGRPLWRPRDMKTENFIKYLNNFCCIFCNFWSSTLWIRIGFT